MYSFYEAHAISALPIGFLALPMSLVVIRGWWWVPQTRCDRTEMRRNVARRSSGLFSKFADAQSKFVRQVCIRVV